jgi:predicted enzyme related to lactoylglutathione lyase
MRNTILATTAVLTLMTGQVQGDNPKPPLPADVGAGRIAWFDLTTTSLAKSKEFYGKLFEWQFEPVAGTDLAVTITSRGAAIGTIRGTEGAISAFNGVIYVQVPDIEVACRKAAELGATIAPGFPFNLPGGTGAIGLFTDPSGHPMGMYARKLIPAAPAAK